MKERKEEGERIPPSSYSSPPPPLSSGRLLDWRKQRGGRVVVTAYCLSSVCCGSSLSTHSYWPSYLYPLNIHAGGGRLQSFSSFPTFWRQRRDYLLGVSLLGLLLEDCPIINCVAFLVFIRTYISLKKINKSIFIQLAER